MPPLKSFCPITPAVLWPSRNPLFFIGRGETGNHLQLTDPRISRQCAAIQFESGRYHLQDRGQRSDLFVNGERIDRRALQDGDVITFGLADSCDIVFRSLAEDSSIPNILSRIGDVSGSSSAPGGLSQLNLLLEATMLLHSQLPLDSVLSTMLDYAITVTHADRDLLLEADSTGSLRARLARRSGGVRLQPESFTPNQTALRLGLQQKSSTITEDLARADVNLQAAQSIVAQQLRAVVVIPLYTVHRASSTEPGGHAERGDLLGVVYLDSRRPAAFSKLDRQILDALGGEAASVLDNARLVARERERQRLEQELRIAREIQQALLPRNFRDFPHLVVRGINLPSLTVSGDYFDVFPMETDRAVFLIADVSGKGLGAALLTTILQGALVGVTAGANASGVFGKLNDFLCEHVEVERYATTFFGILSGDGQLEFINAGHPSPLLLRRSEVSQPFTEGSFPVGLISGADYACARIRLQAGDTLVLFSDVVTEAMDPNEQEYGVDRLREVLSGQDGTSLDDLQKMILDSLEKFTRGATQADDITLLLVRYRGEVPSAGS